MAALQDRVIRGRPAPGPPHRARARNRGRTRAACAVAAVWLLAVPGARTQPAPSGAGPRRIVSFVPAATEMIFAMGAGARVVGVSTYDRFPAPAAALPKVGGLLDPNVEQVLALRPDLVVVYGTQRELRTQLGRAGVPTFDYVHRELSDVTRTMRALGGRLGVPTEAARAADDLDASLSAVRARVAGRSRPSTLLVFGREAGTLRRLHASGGYGFLHDLVELAGGADVWRDVKRESVEMSTEMVLARAPQVIIELHYGDSIDPAALAAERRVWDALGAVPAVRTGQVHLLVGDEFVVPGPRVVLAAEKLARAIHPEVFAAGR